MSTGGLTRRFVLLRALRWLPVGLVLPFLVITPQARGLSLWRDRVVFAVRSARRGARRCPAAPWPTSSNAAGVLVGAALTGVSLLIFATAPRRGGLPRISGAARRRPR